MLRASKSLGEDKLQVSFVLCTTIFRREPYLSLSPISDQHACDCSDWWQLEPWVIILYLLHDCRVLLVVAAFGAV